MLNQYKRTLMVGALLILLTPIVCFKSPDAVEFDENNEAGLSDDELSYALSDLSVADLNALSQLLDVINENHDGEGENDIKAGLTSDELARFKRENTGTNDADGPILNSISNQNEEYIRQLDDSFPNVEQSNLDDKERAHIRVKRY